MNEEKLYQADQRTEEVRHIIEKMPVRFGFYVTMIVLGISVLLLTFGFFIRYPDVVSGQITLNTNFSPVKLVANTNGKLKLGKIKSLGMVKEGQVIAYIENATDPTNVMFIDSLLKQYNPDQRNFNVLREKLPKNFSLGELNPQYYAFAGSLQEFSNYKNDKLFDKQGQNLIKLLYEQQNAINSNNQRVEMAGSTLNYSYKFYRRDSVLFMKKVISESELDKSQMNYLSGKDALQNALNNLITAKQAVQQTESKLQELGIQKPEKEKELWISLVSAYNDLLDHIKDWEQKYVFKSPFNGKVQFLKFYNNNQFIQSGEPVFTVIPQQDKIFGQVILPAQGSGKARAGQEVIVKLDNYPFQEYGSVTGRIRSISLTTNTAKTEESEIDTYLVLIDFPDQLVTNYGTRLDFRAESKGSAEIITNDRRLIQRLFDNLKYIMKK